MPLDPAGPPGAKSAEREAELAVRGALLRSGPIFIIPRPIPGGVAAVLDGVPSNCLPRLYFEGTVSDFRHQLRCAVGSRLSHPRWLANWLVDDIVDKADMMAQLTGAPSFRMRLEVIDDDRCRKFHVDDVRLTLVTTYRGPGTEWISPRQASKLTPGSSPPLDTIRHLARGHVAVMRGAKGATPDRPGVLHRSPPIAGTGIVRLFLAIDEIGAHLH